MAAAKHGDQVKVHYKGTLDDGTQFDSSAGSDPLEFTIGSGRLLKKFEETVVGMTPGESKTVTMTPDEGYGKHNDQLVINMPLEKIPADFEIKEGMALQLNTVDGRSVQVRVTGLSDKEVTLDANHQLAGQNLNFEIELVEIIKEA